MAAQVVSRAVKAKMRPNSVEIVTFKKPKAAKTPITPNATEGPDLPQLPTFNFGKAKLDVQKLGISGFEKEKKKDSEMQLAIKLGAKPYKNKYLKYPVLVEGKRLEKEEVEKENEKRKALGLPMKKQRKKASQSQTRAIQLKPALHFMNRTINRRRRRRRQMN